MEAEKAEKYKSSWRLTLNSRSAPTYVPVQLLLLQVHILIIGRGARASGRIWKTTLWTFVSPEMVTRTPPGWWSPEIRSGFQSSMCQESILRLNKVACVDCIDYLKLLEEKFAQDVGEQVTIIITTLLIFLICIYRLALNFPLRPWFTESVKRVFSCPEKDLLSRGKLAFSNFPRKISFF